MGTTRLLGWSVGTIVSLAALGAVGGCDTSAGTTVLGGAGSARGAAATASLTSATQSVVSSNSSTGSAHSAGPGHEGGPGSGARPTSTHTSTIANSPSPQPPNNNTATAPATSTSIGSPTASATTSPVGRACTSADLSLQAFELTQITPPATFGHSTSPTNPASSTPSGRGVTRPQEMALIFTNVSRSGCVLHGYPSVDFLQAGIHGPLSAPNSFLPIPRATDVHLSPGATASSLVTFITNGVGNPAGSRCDEVVAVRVYPPSSTSALFSAAHNSSKNGHIIPHFFVCGHEVIVRAVQWNPSGK